ncbi:MAG TPA: DUF2231 domain-containing protein [Casimicrobiaceae bacterium]|nr:DUF2231 domain-containing protein [Casimicrobiaceae bacterium]
MESKMRIFGHPIHPMMIAYPVAFYTGALVTYALYGAYADRFWLKFAIALNIVGAGMAIIAALPGFIDWLLAIPGGSPAKRTGLRHMGLNVAALGLFIADAVIYEKYWNTGSPSATIGIILAAVGLFLTVLAGFQGWTLVQDHHVGVREMERPRSAPLRKAG